MDEKINVYDLNTANKSIPYSRKKFYKNQIDLYLSKGKPTLAAEIVDIFLFNDHGELIIQKRSREKTHNPNLQDKSIGGHVKWGDTPDYTVMVETVQELKVPSIVLRNDTDFNKTHNLLIDYLDTVAIIKHVDTQIMKLPKIINNEKIVIANKVHLYFGVYQGRVKTEDREAKGVLSYTLSDLNQEINQMPEAFTDDLKIMIQEYKNQIQKFIKTIAKV